MRKAVHQPKHAGPKDINDCEPSGLVIPVPTVGVAAGNALVEADLLKVALHVINGKPFYGHDCQDALRRGS